MPPRLSRRFFARPTLRVARELLGCRLVRRCDGRRLSGVIVEAEAYIGAADQACHCRRGRTPRTEVMFGRAGVAYVYFTYGMHWMFNIVTECEGFPAAVLIRALAPVEGIDRMQTHRRQTALKQLCSGPAKLTQALRIDGQHHGVDLCARGGDIWLEAGAPLDPRRRGTPVRVGRSARIGVDFAPEPWRSQPWRFYVHGNPFVSK
ncbi:MAG TPA: DNA-3-methyladenine glycosylase [Anaerolineae bacterium]|nr:DNA-3-methyladenine glycosylase [Anaerolineae bacterium]